MQRFLLGLVKKLVIADGVALYVDHVFASPSSFSAPTLWFAAYGFALQIYCDFSGYTDMALGLGRAFGISLPENFRRPYLALSITDFWRRWHCSLSGWLRDYLYIPLGGSRRGTGATYRNLLITMLLGGLWHGAAWTFVAWGGYHGLLLAIERAAGERGSGDGNAIGVIIRRLLTFHLVCIGWVFFRAESFDSLWVFIARMFTIWDLGSIGQTQGLAWALLLATLVTAQGLLGETGRGARIWCRLPAPVQGAALALLVVAAGLLHVDRVAFIYFQF